MLEKFSGNTCTGFSSWKIQLEKIFFFKRILPFLSLLYCCALIFSFLLSPPLWQGWHKKSPISHTAQKIVDGQKFCHGENCHLSKKLLYCNGLPEEKNWTYTTTKNQFKTFWRKWKQHFWEVISINSEAKKKKLC